MAYPGNKPKKKRNSKIEYYAYSRQDMVRIQWCHNKKIFVSCAEKGKGSYHLSIRLDGGDWKDDPAVYDFETGHQKLYEYYKYYYDKYNKQ